MRALGFDPSNDEIVNLVKSLGRENENIDNAKIDFQEFLEIMIFKMVRLWKTGKYLGFDE